MGFEPIRMCGHEGCQHRASWHYVWVDTLTRYRCGDHFAQDLTEAGRIGFEVRPGHIQSHPMGPQ